MLPTLYQPPRRRSSCLPIMLLTGLVIGGAVALLALAQTTQMSRTVVMLRAMAEPPTPVVLELIAQPPETVEVPQGSPLGNARVVLTQGYGVGSHAPAAVWGGVDLAIDGDGDRNADPQATLDAPIYATHDGIARVRPDTWPAGNYLSISSDHYKTAFAHLARYTVEDGQQVQAGQIIGNIGVTGQSTGPHLHYEIWHDGVNVNPLDYGMFGQP